eukprot:3666680-Rhodomonas_salina.1
MAIDWQQLAVDSAQSTLGCVVRRSFVQFGCVSWSQVFKVACSTFCFAGQRGSLAPEGGGAVVGFHARYEMGPTVSVAKTVLPGGLASVR